MKRFLGCLAMSTALFMAVPAHAQSPATSTSVLEEISSAIGPSALANITKAEQIFCYQVSDRPANYTGYTIDGFAVYGFCGIITDDLKKIIISELFTNQDNILFDVTEKCTIRPRLLLRFVRGVDNTDVLLSSPCHSYAIFYGGKINTFNAKPAAQIIDALINPLTQNKLDFVSPALTNQLMPIGLPQTPEQAEQLNKNKNPARKWEEPTVETPQTQGWNKLKRN